VGQSVFSTLPEEVRQPDFLDNRNFLDLDGPLGRIYWRPLLAISSGTSSESYIYPIADLHETLRSAFLFAFHSGCHACKAIHVAHSAEGLVEFVSQQPERSCYLIMYQRNAMEQVQRVPDMCGRCLCNSPIRTWCEWETAQQKDYISAAQGMSSPLQIPRLMFLRRRQRLGSNSTSPRYSFLWKKPCNPVQSSGTGCIPPLLQPLFRFKDKTVRRIHIFAFQQTRWHQSQYRRLLQPHLQELDSERS